MRAVVFGGRAWSETAWLYTTLGWLKDLYGPRLFIIEGGAEGADKLAKLWRQNNYVHGATVQAYWVRDHRIDRSAGHKRNWAMSLLQPQLGIELPGGRGTAGMHRILESSGVPIICYPTSPLT